VTVASQGGQPAGPDGVPPLSRSMLRALVTARGRGGDAVPHAPVSLSGLRVDLAHLAAYDRLCGYAVRDELPSTYLHVLSFRLQVALMTAPQFPLPLPGLVHTTQRLELLRPVRADERLDLSARATELRPHRRGREVVIESQASVGGEPVWRGVSTYLSRGTGGTAHAASWEKPAPGAQARHAPSEIPVGPPAARWRLRAELGRRYAGISGDLNPIHLHPLAARAFGFPRTIVHGMWTAARCLAWLDDRPVGGQVAEVALRRPVLLPSTVELRTGADGGRRTAWVSAVGSPKPLVELSVGK
jgi:acyl dehydratase